MSHPRYPVYVISKGRWDVATTAKFLVRDGVDFRLVVEPQEAPFYETAFGVGRILVLPFHDLGQGSIPARNWVWEHALASGAERHWILDDNMEGMYRWYRKKRVPISARPAMVMMEDFTDRYENIAIAGPNDWMFQVPGMGRAAPPFYLNHRVYSFLLIRNDLPFRWRGRYNEDTDLCLQVLSSGWCTVLFNAVMMDKRTTMQTKGGNTTELYQGDGRLRMARSLERKWPGVVTTTRRYKRPQHHVKDQWGYFDTPLKLKEGVDLGALPPNDYGLTLKALKPVKSARIRALLEEEGT